MSYAYEALGADAEINQISSIFFSQENVERLQEKIKNEIYRESGGKYIMTENQDLNDLLQMMRYIYLRFGENLPHKPVRQVKKLNQLLVNFILPDMMSNIKQYHGYLDTISKPIELMPLPVSLNTSGRKNIKVSF